MYLHFLNTDSTLASKVFQVLTHGLRMTMIVAMDEDGGIGKDGKIPWDIPEDRRYFAEFTTGKQLLMGRKTAESLPSNMKNRDRYIHVLSRNAKGNSVRSLSFSLEQWTWSSLELFFANAPNWKRLYGDELVLCGGGSLYKELAPYCDELHISRIPGRYNCDTGTGHWMLRGNHNRDGRMGPWQLVQTEKLDGPSGVEVDIYRPYGRSDANLERCGINYE